jgi:hypothetical protein
VASSVPNLSGAKMAARNPHQPINRKPPIKALAPMRPTSSATTAKMKSEWA